METLVAARGSDGMARKQKRSKSRPRAMNDVDRRVAVDVKRIRLERGISQEGLGKALGVSFQQVQKYEPGKNRVTIGRLAEICDVLGTTLKRITRED
jgi:DNA-binding Xre family transcriptional regulator